jgi:DNA-binding response OmpR family regulator
MNGSRHHVLVVDDDDQIRDFILSALASTGLETTGVSSYGSATAALATGEFDLVILDVGLPDGSGLDLMKDFEQPAIIVSGYSSEADLIVGLELGADDYVSKPFSSRELIARVRAMLRRLDKNTLITGTGGTPNATLLTFADLNIDSMSREVLGNGEPIAFTRMEFDLLHWLASHPRQVFTKTHLLSSVWGCEDGWLNEATVTEHVRRVRKKLETATGSSWIATVWGVGYRFEPPSVPAQMPTPLQAVASG